jgi:ABC-type multidrug transport system fused ATPase/permease subunit
MINYSTIEMIREGSVFYRKLLKYLRPYRRRVYLGILFAVVGGLFNGVMLVAFKLIFSITLGNGDEKEAFEPVTLPGGHIIDPNSWVPQGTEQGPLIVVVVACLAIPFMLLIRGMLGYLSRYCMMWAQNKMLYDLRASLFGALLGKSLQFYSGAKTGELMQSVFNQTKMATGATVSLIHDSFKHPVSILVIFAFLLWQDWIFTLSAFVVFPLCLWPVIHVSRKVRKAGANEEEEAGMLMVTMQETFAGINVVKSHAREDHELKKFNDADEKMLAHIMRWQKAMEIVGPLVETVASIGIAAGLFYAWVRGISATDFFLMVMAMTQIYPHAKALSRLKLQLEKAMVASSKVMMFIESKPDIDDAPDAVVLDRPRGSLAFHGVSFGYKKGIPAVSDIDLELAPGRFYALVGPSGAGKSTIFSLLMRFYDPGQGYITLDGIDLRRIKQSSLRDHIGLVGQDTFLFHDSIEENIRYGRLDASGEDVRKAAELAYAHEFIIEQSNGYETVIGDKGRALSGGQQQRLSIARAILRDAPILLMDEAYSALDTESEKKVQAAVDNLSRGRTVIAIAHRLSTILHADEIVVMKDSRVLDRGRHDELLERCKFYKRLYRMQFSKNQEA